MHRMFDGHWPLLRFVYRAERRYTDAMLHRVKEFVERNERRLSLIAFVGGFLWDNIMLTEVDRLRDNLVILGYLLVAFACIVLVNAHRTRVRRNGTPLRVIGFIEFAMQFALGGLFSIFIVFFSRSGAVVASAPFLVVLFGFFIANELLKKHYERFTFLMSVFFVALFSYCVLVAPVFIGSIGAGVFLLSGVAAPVLFALALRVLRFVAAEELQQSRRILIPIVAIIFVTFNFLYFNNMIPPIPLSLKEIGVYHDVSRTRNGEYVLTFEKPSWYDFGEKTSDVFRETEDGTIYAFSSIYAPTNFDTTIVHRWSKYDETAKEWVSVNAVPFTISGGRAEGYRGYSVKEHGTPGRWRVDVETPRGQLIGRFKFTVVDSATPPQLVTETR